MKKTAGLILALAMLFALALPTAAAYIENVRYIEGEPEEIVFSEGVTLKIEEDVELTDGRFVIDGYSSRLVIGHNAALTGTVASIDYPGDVLNFFDMEPEIILEEGSSIELTFENREMSELMLYWLDDNDIECEYRNDGYTVFAPVEREKVLPWMGSAEFSGKNAEIPEGEYEVIRIEPNTTVRIDGEVRLNSLDITHGSVTVIIGENGKLKSNVNLSAFNCRPDIDGNLPKLEIENGGAIDVEALFSDTADEFENWLKENGIIYKREGERITVTPCSHDKIRTEESKRVFTVTDKYCADCGKFLGSETTEDTGGSSHAGSVLSDGNPVIVCAVAGAAVVFGTGGFLFGRKKKKAEE